MTPAASTFIEEMTTRLFASAKAKSMTAVFTLIPPISKQVDGMLPNADVSDLERCLAQYINGTNFRSVPTEHEFLALSLRIAQLISPMSWTKANPKTANTLVSFILSGIAITAGWPAYQIMFQKAGYKPSFTMGYAYYQAVERIGLLDGSIPHDPFVSCAPAAAAVPTTAAATPAPAPTPSKVVRPVIGRGKHIPAPKPAPKQAQQPMKPLPIPMEAVPPPHNPSAGKLLRSRGKKGTAAAAAAATSAAPSSLYPRLDDASAPSAPPAPGTSLDDQIQLASTPTVQLSALDGMFEPSSSPSEATSKKKGKGKERDEDIGQ